MIENIFLIGRSKGLLVLCFGFGMYLLIVFINFMMMFLYFLLFLSVLRVEFWIIGRLLFGKLYFERRL